MTATAYIYVARWRWVQNRKIFMKFFVFSYQCIQTVVIWLGVVG